MPDNILDRLGSTAFWESAGTTGLKVLIIILLGWFLASIVRRAANGFVARYKALPEDNPKRFRAMTIGNLLGSTSKYAIWIVVIFMALSELGFNMQGLLATAGIAGLAIGFGAQTLVKDVISGVFLLFDDMIAVGDVVRIRDEVATIEFIGVRAIRARKLNGEVLMIPSGELGMFGNLSIDFARIVVPVTLGYEQDTETTLAILHEIGSNWIAENKDAALEEEPTVQALVDFGDSGVTARILIKVKPGEQWDGERAIRMTIKKRFAEEGIDIPFPRRTVYIRNEAEAIPAKTRKTEE